MRPRATIPPAAPWHPARPGLERAYRVDRSGRTGPTKGQADGRFWRSVGHGWFRPVEAPTSVDQRIVEASYHAPALGAVTGWAALRWMGGSWFTGTGPNGLPTDVPILSAGSHRSAAAGVRFSQERFRPCDLVDVDGLRVTPAARSVAFEMRHATALVEAVVALDMACFNDLVSRAEVGGWIAESAAWTGIQVARDALALSDENSWSPAETRFRFEWTLVAQLGPVLSNVPVFDLHGRHLLTPDLLDPVAGVVGEYQGATHLERDQRRRDIAREAMLRDHGLEYVERLAGEDRTRFLIRLRSAYARARRIPAADRRWTLSRPTTWQPTETVAQRRALLPHQRRALLSHRWLDQAA